MRISRKHIKRVRFDSVECTSMKDELAAVEQFGADLGEADSSAYMFNKEEEVDMNAFCDRFLDKQRLGASSDASSYFEQLSERFGFACRQELQPKGVEPSAPSATAPVSESNNVSTT